MEMLKFALIGCGAIGKMHLEIITSLSNAKLVAVCDSNKEMADSFASQYGCKSYYDYNELMQDKEVDAVTITLPSGLHYAATVAAANAKKHVMCEKPIDISVANAKEMVKVCRENNVTFGVILQHRFDEAVIALRKAVSEGLMGNILWGASRTIWYRDEQYFDNPWRGTWAVDGGGALINQSIHYIDLLLSFLGTVGSVSGKCRKLLHHGIEAEDLGVANLEFTNGKIGTIEGSTVCYPGLYAELCIFGEKGSAVIRNDHLLSYCFESGSCDFMDKILNPELANKQHIGAAVPPDSHKRQYEDYVASILSGKKPQVTGTEALHGLEVIKSIYTSSNEKREVFLNNN